MTYSIVRETNHFRIIAGRVYQDIICRRSDGELRVVAYPAPAVAA